MAYQNISLKIDADQIKTAVTDGLSDFRNELLEARSMNEQILEEFEQLKGIVLDMFNVVSYMAEHWER